MTQFTTNERPWTEEEYLNSFKLRHQNGQSILLVKNTFLFHHLLGEIKHIFISTIRAWVKLFKTKGSIHSNNGNDE